MITAQSFMNENARRLKQPISSVRLDDEACLVLRKYVSWEEFAANYRDPLYDPYLESLEFEMTIRTNPPSDQPNNQDVFVWALYLLGGADRDVDVEEIYLKCFELAPARLGWRTRPDLPDYKKASKALQSIEAKTHSGLLLRPHEYSRRLSVEGVRWVETYRETLAKNYSQGKVQASLSNNQHERRRQEVKGDPVWNQFKEDPETLTSVELASVMNCTAASTDATWRTRINELRRASDVLGDEDLMKFADFVQKKVLGA